MPCRLPILAWLVLLGLWLGSTNADDLTVLPVHEGPDSQRNMMTRYLRAEQQRFAEQAAKAFESRTSAQAIAAYQKEMREFMVAQLGGFPERTPLHPQITGKIPRDGFVLEKVLFESQPKHFVTAALYLPDDKRYAPPYPGVIIPCGHSANGKAAPAYQKACMLLATNGIAALCFDPIEQGERFQLLDESGKPLVGGTAAHSLVGVGSTLLGRNTARFEICDGMRAIDYLQSRPEIDPRKIGCMGNSGGGTQTAYLMSLDDRLVAASPSCYITSFERLMATIGPQDAEQNIFGQLAQGLDHADYLMLRAPQPALVCVATRDFFDIRGAWDSFRQAKRLYTRLGYSERIEIVEHDDKHGYNQPLREAAARWMLRWLAGKDVAVVEPAWEPFTDAQLQVTPNGQVMLLPDARTVYDLNRDEARRWREARDLAAKPRSAAEQRRAIRATAGIRSLDKLSSAKLETVGVVERKGYKIERQIMHAEAGLVLPALHFAPDKPFDSDAPENKDREHIVVFVHELGKQTAAEPGGELEKLALSGVHVFAVDLRGTGETHPNPAAKPEALFGGDSANVSLAYLLGKTYVGMRAEDLIVARNIAAGLSDRFEAKVGLIAVGSVGVPALHAAALHPELFTKMELRHTLQSWELVIDTPRTTNQQVNAVHGALRVYDLPDLVKLAGDNLHFVEPVDANGKRIGPR